MSLLQTSGGKAEPIGEHRFYAEIVTNITTRNSLLTFHIIFMN